MELIRLSKKVIEILFKDDITNRGLRFVMKADRTLNGLRLIEKNNQLGGGSDNEISAVYYSSENYTKIKIIINSQDTEGLNGGKYYADLLSFSLTDDTDKIILCQWDIDLIPSVQNPTDGTNLPADSQRYIVLLASNFNDGDFLRISETNGTKNINGLSLQELKDLLE